MKTKPMYLFMNMLFQRTITQSKKDPSPHGQGYQPRLDAQIADHAEEHEHLHAHEPAHDHSH
jgi:hypothetical protein